jgi:flavin-dependent dehydrogenase
MDCLFDDEWKHATNILRLYADLDRINGLAWAIPLGSYISVGISMPFDDNEFSDEQVMKLLEEAYARRGLDFVKTFACPRQIMGVPRQQYFIHERGYGANWMMAGPSFGQVWFPSASGVGAALVAGQIAPKFLRSPQEAGEQYEGYVRGLLESHKTFDRMIAHHHSVMTAELMKKESNGIVGENVKRVARLATIQNGPVGRSFARVLLKAVNREGTAASGCKIWKADLADQTATIFSEA